MKWFVVGLALTFTTSAFAGNNCEAGCSDTTKQCVDSCKKMLKKDNADKIGFCQDKCKEFEGECKKECKNDAAPKKR